MFPGLLALGRRIVTTLNDAVGAPFRAQTSRPELPVERLLRAGCSSEPLQTELGSMTALEGVAEMCGAQTPELLADMRAAVESGDAEALSGKAHKLKGVV